MKYIIRKLNADFIFDELERVRKQFVDALTYTMESANIIFDKQAGDPLDIYIEYDFQQKEHDHVIYGFNLRDEIARNFKLDINKFHASEQLLAISQHLRQLADELDSRYKTGPVKSAAEIQDQQETDYAKKVNRSYREVLKDALAMDEVLKKEQALEKSKGFLDGDYKINPHQEQPPLLNYDASDH